jgi:hypothetical protein
VLVDNAGRGVAAQQLLQPQAFLGGRGNGGCGAVACSSAHAGVVLLLEPILQAREKGRALALVEGSVAQDGLTGGKLPTQALQ